MLRDFIHRSRRDVSSGDERGFIMVLALLMLVVLSIMGGAAMTVRNTEQQIVTNSEIIKSNFFAVEAVTLEGTTALENTDNDMLRDLDLHPTSLSWLKPNPGAAIDLDLTRSNNWPSASIVPQETALKNVNRNITPAGYLSDGTSAKDRIRYAGVQGNLNSDNTSYKVCSGSDLSDPDKTENCYSVFGMYDVKSGTGKGYAGRRMLMVGYKKLVYN